MVKINLTNNSITYKSIKQNNEAIKNNKKSNKLDKLFIYGTPIVVAISSAIFLKKTSKEYIEKIVKDKVIDEKIKERKYLFKNFEIELAEKVFPIFSITYLTTRSKRSCLLILCLFTISRNTTV